MEIKESAWFPIGQVPKGWRTTGDEKRRSGTTYVLAVREFEESVWFPIGQVPRGWRTTGDERRRSGTTYVLAVR